MKVEIHLENLTSGYKIVDGVQDIAQTTEFQSNLSPKFSSKPDLDNGYRI